ncbi:MAG: hypothetical protein QM831_36605 [Kofleriaceae bacterium]
MNFDPAITDLPPIESAASLDLTNLPELRSLAGIEKIKGLRSIVIDTDALALRKSFDLIAKLPELDEMTLIIKKTASPRGFDRLPKLRALKIVSRELTPSLTKQLRSVQTLELRIPSLADAFAPLAKLTELALFGPKQLPPSIGKLAKLQRLRIIAGKFKTVPDELFACPALEQLALGAPIKKLPPAIGQLKKLKRLDLTSTQLVAVPAELAALKHLKELWLPPTVKKVPDELAAVKLDKYVGPVRAISS